MLRFTVSALGGCVFSCIFLCVFLSFGQSLFAFDTTRVYQLNEVQVVEHYRNSEVRSAAPLQILSAKQLQKLNVLQVSDAVKHFAGVTVKDYGGIGGLKTVSVRSLGASHTAVSYDGITITDAQTGQIDIGRFSLENVDMLSLNNGQSDNIYQPARLFASGAVLNIRTLTPIFSDKKNTNAHVSLKSGSFGLFNPSFYWQQKMSKSFTSAVSAEWQKAHGKYSYLMHHSYLGDGITSLEQRQNTDVENLRVETTLYFNSLNKTKANVKAYFYNSERGLPGATILNNIDNFSLQRMWDRNFFVQTHFEKDVSNVFSYQINAKYNNAFLHYLDPTYLNDLGRMESKYFQQEYYASFSALYRTFRMLSFSFSTDAFVNKMQAEFEYQANTIMFARPIRSSILSVLAAKYVSEKFIVATSLLSTNVKEHVEVGTAANNQHKWSPFVSTVYKPFATADLRIRMFYKNIFRLPSFNDLYYSRIGNASLLPETTNQLNFGLTYASKPTLLIPHFSFTFDVFRNNITDKIVAMPTKNIFVWTMVNLGKVQVSGFDANTELAIGITKSCAFTLGGSYSYQRAIDITDSQNGTFGHQIAYTPRISGSAKAALETTWVDVAYALLWSGKRYGGFQNFADNRLPAYSDHSLSGARNFQIKKMDLKLNVEVLNLFNQNYAIVKWFPMPGRSFRFTLTYKY